MNIKFVDLHIQYLGIKDEIDSAIAEVIRQAAFIGTRSNTFISSFEKDFANYIGIKHCVGCANGTDSIEILLKGLGIGPGDEVLVPALTWISTAEAVSNIGAYPVFVDILPHYFTIDPEKVEQKITSKTKAIIPVHLYGLPAEMEPIIAIAQKHGLKVIEDCAQAHGATYRGKHVGTIGNAGSFSFFPGKNLGAFGDAGGMVTSDDSLVEKIRMIANHGTKDKTNHDFEGRNSRLDGIQAAVLSVKLKHLDKWVSSRRKVAGWYDGALTSNRIIKPSRPSYSNHAFHIYEVLLDNRDDIQHKLSESGVQTGIHYPLPLPFTNAYKKRCNADEFPNAKAIIGRNLSLPIFPELSESDVNFIAQLCS